jgi:putative ABC transport system permease protein
VKIRYSTAKDGKPVSTEKAFSVRGILTYIGSGIIPVDQMVFISTSSANSDRSSDYDGAYVITDSPNLNGAVQDELVQNYNVNVLSPKTIADTISRISNALSLVVGNIAAVSLLVASVGIITAPWTSMMERIREIGILKAIGFSDHLIMRLFLNEALIIGAIGGFAGMLLGVGLAYLMPRFLSSEFSFISPIFAPQTFILTWLLCLALSIVSGFYPAWRASRLDPVVALRHE